MYQSEQKFLDQELIVSLFGHVQCSMLGQNLNMPQKFFPMLALVAAHNHPAGVKRSTIVECLWGDTAPRKADASFRQLLTRIKSKEKDLGSWLIAVADGRVRYNHDLIQVDLQVLLSDDFQKNLRAGDDDCLKWVSNKTSEELLEGISIETEQFTGWLAELDVQLSKTMTSTLLALLDNEAVMALPFKRKAVAEQLLTFDPSQELAHRVLMEYHHQTGDVQEARKVYDNCVDVLQNGYGVTPELSTIQLAASLGIDRKYAGSNMDQGAAAAADERSKPEFQTHNGNIWQIGSPRIVLLPPQLIGVDSSSATIIDVLLDDVTAGLTRYRSISVVAAHTGREAVRRNTSEAMDLKEKYGVHYAVKTSIKPSTSGSTATFLLIDCRTSECAAVFETGFSEKNLLELFQQLGNEIVRQFVSAIERREVDFPTATRSKTAYRHFLEGRMSLWRSDLPDLRRARTNFNKAINASSTFAPAHAGVARTLSMEKLVRGLTDNELLIQSLEFAERSIRLDPQDGRGLREKGFTNLYLRRHDESLSSFGQSEAINPNDADMLADFADALSHSGIPDQALVKCLRAKALNPEHPDYYDWIHASILYQTAKYEEAVALLLPLGDNPAVARLLAASAAMSGNQGIARRYAQIFRESYPEFETDSLTNIVPDKDAQDTRHLLDGLHLAGIR